MCCFVCLFVLTKTKFINSLPSCISQLKIFLGQIPDFSLAKYPVMEKEYQHYHNKLSKLLLQFFFFFKTINILNESQERLLYIFFYITGKLFLTRLHNINRVYELF